jgi:hypothetical protein
VFNLYDYNVDHSPCYSCLFAKGKNKGIPWWKKTPWQKSERKKEAGETGDDGKPIQDNAQSIRNNRTMKASVAILLALTTIFFLMF